MQFADGRGYEVRVVAHGKVIAFAQHRSASITNQLFPAWLSQRSAQSSKSRGRGGVRGRERVSIRFAPSTQLLKEGFCRSERRPLFRRLAREKA